MQTSTKISLFRTNNRQDLHIEFEMRKKRMFKKTEEFVSKIKEVHKEIKTALKRSQEKIKKYANRRKNKAKEYQVGD